MNGAAILSHVVLFPTNIHQLISWGNGPGYTLLKTGLMFQSSCQFGFPVLMLKKKNEKWNTSGPIKEHNVIGIIILSHMLACMYATTHTHARAHTWTYRGQTAFLHIVAPNWLIIFAHKHINTHRVDLLIHTHLDAANDGSKCQPKPGHVFLIYHCYFLCLCVCVCIQISL